MVPSKRALQQCTIEVKDTATPKRRVHMPLFKNVHFIQGTAKVLLDLLPFCNSGNMAITIHLHSCPDHP